MHEGCKKHLVNYLISLNEIKDGVDGEHVESQNIKKELHI